LGFSARTIIERAKVLQIQAKTRLLARLAKLGSGQLAIIEQAIPLILPNL